VSVSTICTEPEFRTTNTTQLTLNIYINLFALIRMAEILPPPLTIKTWAEEDRPREKLMTKGKAALSEAELLAILIGSGTVSISAVELCKQILASVNNNLHELAKLSLADLQKFKGIGEAKAITILAALELGRRRKEAEVQKRVTITSSKDAFLLLKPDLMDLPYEEFWIILLNKANQVIKKVQISRGGLAGTVADVRLMFKFAIENLASGMILVHNHPSGNTKPSSQDLLLTKKVKEAGLLMDILVLDHIIFTDNAYLSFADEELL
jgi:DNA repair protein RadC